MNISEKLTEQKVEEILMSIYGKGQQSDKLEARDLILEIKQHIILVIHSSK